MAGAGKKIAIAGIATILVVGVVVGAVVGINRHNANKSGGDGASSAPIAGTNKAVQAICSSTDYKQTCQDSLSNANTTDPKGLIKAAFEATITYVDGAIKNSTLLKKAAADDSTKDALKVCEEVLGTAVDDLKRSADKLEEFDPTSIGEFGEDLKTWLSAVITYQETCIDAFENTTGNTGEKMKNLLKTAKELSSNGLAMVGDISSFISSLALGKSSRRLLETGYAGDPTDYAPGDEPHFGRRLLETGYAGDPTDYAPGDEPHFGRRLLDAAAGKPKPNAVVAQDGSGQFKTISAAIATVPKKNTVPFVIYVKAGTYKESVNIPKGANHIIMYGDGPLKTIVTGSKSFAGGVKTFHTATFAVNAEDFVAKDMAFENTAGAEGHQAVALRVSGDRAVFYNCHMNGFQDTLYNQVYRQYYRDCTISGTIDFIFGDAPTVFQNCIFVVRKPLANQGCMVTAQGRIDPRSVGVNVIQNGTFTAEPAFLATTPLPKAYLGRPWKQLSRTIIMQSYIGGFISPDGWSPWAGTFGQDTCYYGEYANRGPGANTARRVQWKGIQKMTPQVAVKWTAGQVFLGRLDWISAAGVPIVPTIMDV